MAEVVYLAQGVTMQLVYKWLAGAFFLVGMFFAGLGISMLFGKITEISQATGVSLLILANTCFGIALIGMLQVDILTMLKKR